MVELEEWNVCLGCEGNSGEDLLEFYAAGKVDRGEGAKVFGCMEEVAEFENLGVES